MKRRREKGEDVRRKDGLNELDIESQKVNVSISVTVSRKAACTTNVSTDSLSVSKEESALCCRQF